MTSSTTFERHAQTIIGGLLLALLLWAGNSLMDMRVQLAHIAGQMASFDRGNVTRDAEAAHLRDRVRALELTAARAETVVPRGPR